MTRQVNDIILDLIGAEQTSPPRPNRTPGSLGFDVYDGVTDPPERDITVVHRRTPYAVFYGSPGIPQNPRLTGRHRGNSVFWSISYVGKDRNQAMWAAERIRAALLDKRPVVPGKRVGLVRIEPTVPRVRRDDDAIHADGSPLFYGFDDYALPIML